MRFPLRNLFLASAVLAGAALATNTARAQVRLEVPFNFTAAGKACPAGAYWVEESALRATVTLRAVNAPRGFTFIIGPGEPGPIDSRVVLTFDDLGESHVLRTIQYRNLITAQLDKKTKEYVPTRIVSGQ